MNYINYDEENIQSFEYETTMISDGNIIGTCELGKAEIQMLNDSNEYSSLKGSWIRTIHGSFYIYDVAPVQEKVNIKLSCYDIKYKLDKKYDSSKHSFPCSLKTWRNSIYNDSGVQFDDSDFPNGNLILEKEPYIEEGASNRQVMSMIAQAGASAVATDKNDIFYFIWFEDTVHTVNDWLDLTTENESTEPINVLVLGRGDVEDNVYYPVELPENKVEFRIDNNYILDPQDSREDMRYITRLPVYNQIQGFSYLVFNMRTQDVDNKLSIKLGQKIRYLDIYRNELEAYVMTKKIKYLGGNLADDDNYEITLSSETINESSTDYSYSSGVVNRITNVERKTDKLNGEIIDVIESVSEQNTKISSVKQDIDRIEQEIGDIADITISADGLGTVRMDNINQSEPIYIKVHPTATDVSFIYPDDDLYPEDPFYPLSRDIVFKNGNYEVRYEIPDDLLFYDNENYDEFVLDYENQKCYVTKRIGIDENNQRYVLERDIVTEYDYPEIILTTGDYTIYVESFTDAYIFVRLMAQNIYTDQFATRIEVKSAINQSSAEILSEVSASYALRNELENAETQLNSRINQTATEISTEVSKKVGNNEIISKINQSAEQVSINANKISLAGKTLRLGTDNITITSYNFNVDSNGNMTCGNANITGGNISLSGATKTVPKMEITGTGYAGYSGKLRLFSDGIAMINSSGNEIGSLRSIRGDYTEVIALELTEEDNSYHFRAFPGGMIFYKGSYGQTQIFPEGIETPSLYVSGSKNRVVTIDNGKKVCLGAYETATPYFGDIGSEKTNDDGICRIEIEDIFSQTIEKDDYKVFIQECGDGHLYVEKHKDYFIVKGTPNLEFDWELKAIQKGYKDARLKEMEKMEKMEVDK